MFGLLKTWTNLKCIRMDHLERKHQLLSKIQHEPCPETVILFMMAMNEHHLRQSKSVYSIGLFRSVKRMPDMLNEDEHLINMLETELELHGGDICVVLRKLVTEINNTYPEQYLSDD